MPDDYCFVVATYGDLSEADASFSAVGQLHEDRGTLDEFDAVTLAKKVTGEVRFGRRGQRPSPTIDQQPARCSLAAGLAAALYPSVGTDLPADWQADLETLNAVAGAVQRGLGRSGLTAVGDFLDDGPAALIAACTIGLAHPVERLLGAHRPVIVIPMAVDTVDLDRLCRRSLRYRLLSRAQSGK